jgi:hypothetical protein
LTVRFTLAAWFVFVLMANFNLSAATPAKPADVKMENGVLRGQVVTPEGQPCASINVEVWHQDRLIGATQTDKSGRFAVGGVRGGAHYVVAGNGYTLCRCWTHEMAPPSAREAALVVCGDTTARGKCDNCGGHSGGLGFVHTHPWLTAAAVVGATAGIVAVTDDDDHKPASP